MHDIRICASRRLKAEKWLSMSYKTSWFISGGRCEYLAKDKALMEWHKMERTANSQESVYCGICELEARKLSILEVHLEIRHMSKKALW